MSGAKIMASPAMRIADAICKTPAALPIRSRNRRNIGVAAATATIISFELHATRPAASAHGLPQELGTLFVQTYVQAAIDPLRRRNRSSHVLSPRPGGRLLSNLGEATETLEFVHRRRKVIQYMRGNFSCRGCDTIVQAVKRLAKIHLLHTTLCALKPRGDADCQSVQERNVP